MSHVERVAISDYKGLRSVDLDCGQFTVLTGRNGAGKSSVLEAIELAHRPQSLERHGKHVSQVINREASTAEITAEMADGTALSATVRPPDMRSKRSLIKYILLMNVFVGREGANGRYFRLDEEVAHVERLLGEVRVDDRLLEELDIDDRVVTVDWNGDTYRYAWSIEDTDEIDLDLIDVADEIVERIDGIDGDYELSLASHPPEGVFLDGEPDAQRVEYLFPTDPARDTPRAEDALGFVRVREFLNEHDVFPGKTVASFDFDELVFADDGERYALPYQFLGDGTKLIAELVWQLVGDEELPDVVLMEEPETHLHPGYVKQLVTFLIEFAREEDVQLFLTTHNVDFVKELFNDSTAGDHRDWLTEEFRLVQMTELSPKQFDYERAQNHIENLHLDLRGL